jgi:hypothetical protein
MEAIVERGKPAFRQALDRALGGGETGMIVWHIRSSNDRCFNARRLARERQAPPGKAALFGTQCPESEVRWRMASGVRRC